MSIVEKENALFEEWKTDVVGLVRDGVVNESAFLKSTPKIVFVLKEVNDTTDGGGWDLREVLTRSSRWQTWNVIARWVKGIHALPQEVDWQDLKDIDQAERTHQIASIVAMNLKKSPGGASSNGDVIWEFASEHAAKLRRQFDLYNPDLVVCCGTAIPFVRSVFAESERTWRYTSRGVKYWEFEPGKYLFDYYHPQVRYPGPFLHFGLIDAVKELMEYR